MTEQQFLIGLLREISGGIDISDVAKIILDRMETLETQRSSTIIKTYNDFKETYLPNDTSRIAEKYINCIHDYNYAWGSILPQPCKKCGKPCDTFTVSGTS